MAEHTGAMIALLPIASDAQRLVVDGGLKPEELHVTLAYLGESDALTGDQKHRIRESVQMLASNYGPFAADVFNISMFNPNGEDPCVVLGFGGIQFAYLFADIEQAVRGIYTQRRPYIPHMTLRYTDDASIIEGLKNRTGSVRFDRVRIGFGGEYMDFPLNPQGAVITAAVNSKYWRSWPVAPRETKFNADDAINRIMQWSGGSASKFNSAFLFRTDKGQPQNPESYRLPIADVIGGKLTLIPRAVFSAAVILSGGHGGLEGVVDENEREELKNVVNQIYADLQQEYQDPRVRPPWLLGRTKDEREEDEAEMARTASIGEDPYGRGEWVPYGLVASVNTSWSLPLADVDHPWDGGAARKRVWDWADEDFRKYRRAFLWYDQARPDQKNSYKLPIADVIDGELKIVPRAVNAVAAVLGGARGGVDIPDEDMDDVARVVERLQKRFHKDSETAAMWGESAGYGIPEDDECPEGQHKMPDGTCMDDEDMESMEAAGGPVYPPSSAFEYKYGQVRGPEPFTVTADGSEARGHLWLWNKCHAGIVDECVMAPRTATGYKYFHNGQVLTSDGKLVKVGKITMGTGHAGPNMRWMPAADHYDNTGTVASIVRITEDPWGGYANGVPVSSLTDEQVQELRRSPISGDWRRINGNLELVAALAVNTPGFPIVASINGETQSLVAAGVLTDEVLASARSELSEVEMDLTAQVDALDEKLTAQAVRGRDRKWAKLMAALDERKK